MPCRNPKKPNPVYTLPRLTNSYVGDRPPLNLVTYPGPFRAATARIVEMEPSQFEKFPHDTRDTPVSLRPSPSPLSPRNPRRQLARTDTDKTLSPVSESPPRSQSPNTISPPTSIPSGKPVLGKDVDELVSPLQIRHWSRHEYSHQHAADSCAYQFDTPPSPPTNSCPCHCKSADVSGGVWPIYNRVSQESDKKLFSGWNADLDLMLLFVSLLLDRSP